MSQRQQCSEFPLLKVQQCLWQVILIKVSTVYVDLVNTQTPQLKEILMN